MHLELRHLRYFIAVAEERHFGRAATRLHMTQPPLSQTIQALESLLGVALFVRSRRTVELTAAGLALLPEARRLVQQAETLPDIARRAAGGTSGLLRLSFISTADYSTLPSLLKQFRSHYPQVNLELREATTDIQIDDLVQGKIDAGLLLPPIPDRLHKILDYAPLQSDPLVAAVPAGILPAGQAVSAKVLAQWPLVIFPRRISPFFHDTILSCFHEAGVTPHIGQHAIQMQTIVGLVSAGMGIALVPQSVSNLKRPGVDYLPLSGRVPAIETGLAWRRDNQAPALAAFRSLVLTPLQTEQKQAPTERTD